MARESLPLNCPSINIPFISPNSWTGQRVLRIIFWTWKISSKIIFRNLWKFHFLLTDRNMLTHSKFNSSYADARTILVHYSPYRKYVTCYTGWRHASPTVRLLFYAFTNFLVRRYICTCFYRFFSRIVRYARSATAQFTSGFLHTLNWIPSRFNMSWKFLFNCPYQFAPRPVVYV